MLKKQPRLLHKLILTGNKAKEEHHYPLFCVAEGMSPLTASFWVMMNVAGNAYKKIFYVKKQPTRPTIKAK